MARVGDWHLVAVLLFATGCAAQDGGQMLRVDGSYGYLPVSVDEAGLYFSITNPGTTADTLLSLVCDEADAAMLHQSVPDGAMVRMEHLDLLEIPAGATVRLAPGALHVMLTGLDALPAAGDSLHLALEFARAGTLRLTIPLIAYGESPPGG